MDAEINKQYIKELQLRNNLKLFHDAREKSDYKKAILYMEHAVACGFQGDYSIIGTCLFFGHHNVPKDPERGIDWITRFVCDMEKGGVGKVDVSSSFMSYLALGSYNLYRVDSNEYSDSEKKEYVKKGIDLWKYAASLLRGNTIPENIHLEVFDLAVAFFNGHIMTYAGTEIIYDKDYRIALDLFTKLFRVYEEYFGQGGRKYEGDDWEYLKKSGRYLALIYDEGLGINKNEKIATEYYKKLALSHDSRDIKNLLLRFRNMINVPDVLPWKRDEKITIKVMLYERRAYSRDITPYRFIKWLETSDTLMSYDELPVRAYKGELDILEAIAKKINIMIKEKLHENRILEQLIDIGNRNNGLVTYSRAEELLKGLNDTELEEVINNITKAGILIGE